MPGNKINMSTPTVDCGVAASWWWVVQGNRTCSAWGVLNTTKTKEEAACWSSVPSRCSAAAQFTHSNMVLIALQVAFNIGFQPLLAGIWMGQWAHIKTQTVSAILDFKLELFHYINV